MSHSTAPGPVSQTSPGKKARPWILIAAYDVSLGETSEGHVAFNILKRLARRYRVVLVTRRNNQRRLMAAAEFRFACPGMRVLGFDLPAWARWWKRGSRFYGLYAYLWQLGWPLALRSRGRLLRSVELVHVLNFHNDSIASLAWVLGRPVVWGPINHNELVSRWRRILWPLGESLKHAASFYLRCIAWRLDPLLRLTVRRADVILSAGSWVDRRLALSGSSRVLVQSQLGVDPVQFSDGSATGGGMSASGGRLIVHAGRLHWLKGLDLAIEALTFLPDYYRLLLVGSGPAERSLRALANRLGVDARIEFHPPVARGDLPRVYANASAFVFTSPEVAGLAWVEALCCGLPVVGFDGESELARAARVLPGIILSRRGTSRADAVRAFAEAINHACQASTDRPAVGAAAIGRYDWNRVVGEIESAYAMCRKEA